MRPVRARPTRWLRGIFPTVHRAGATPVPIPNTEVKPCFGDGTAGFPGGRVARRWDLFWRRRSRDRRRLSFGPALRSPTLGPLTIGPPDRSSRPPLFPMQEGEETSGWTVEFAAVAVALAASLLGCAGSAWRHARSEDTISAYHAFLRDSRQPLQRSGARAARARRGSRSARRAAASRRFEPSTRLRICIAELDPLVEELFFHHARAVGTAESYRELPRTPSERLARRLAPRGISSTSRTTASAATSRRSPVRRASIRRATTLRRPREAFAAMQLRELDRVRSGRCRRRRELVHARRRATSPRVSRSRRHGLRRAAGIATEALADRRERARVEPRRAPHDSTRRARDLGRAREGEDDRARDRGAHRGQVWSAWTAPGDLVRFVRVSSSAVGSARRRLDPVRTRIASSYWADSDGEFFVPVARWNTEVLARPSRAFSKPAIAVDVGGNASRRRVRRRRFPGVRPRAIRRSLVMRRRLSPRP